MKDNTEPLILIVIIVLFALIIFFGREAYVQNQIEITPMATGTPTLEPTDRPTITPRPTQTRTATPTVTPRATETAEPTPTRELDGWALMVRPVSHVINCEDGEIGNGYYFPDQGGWGNDFCVPGMITKESQFYNPPDHFYGIMSSYPEGLMERMCEINGPCDGYRGGVALVSCSAIGKSVWLKAGERNWSGPYLVVDCGAREHVYYHHVVLNLAVEVGYKTTQRWGFTRAGYIEVSFGGPRSSSPVGIGSWWVYNVLEWEDYEVGNCGEEHFDISEPLCE